MTDSTRCEYTTGQTHQHDFGQTVLDDITADLPRAMQRDLRDVYEFYLDEQTRAELARMGKFSRWAFLLLWILKNSVLKLSSSRRLLLLASVVFFVQGVLVRSNPGALIIGFFLLSFVLLLELKDKLLAQDELDTGRAVQTALMPRDNPVIPGWETWLYTRPANDVGGDLVDYLPLGRGRVGIALGDVAGKGLGAALLMARLQATIRALAPDRDSIPSLGSDLNAIFCRDGLRERFVSLVYMEVEPENGHLNLLNAGHFPPLHVRNGRVSELPKGSMALGLMPEACYGEQFIPTEENDLLVVYSDGLTEARNPEGGFYDQVRLVNVLSRLNGLSAEQVGKRILDEVDQFVRDARPVDDLSLIVMRRVGSGQAH